MFNIIFKRFFRNLNESAEKNIEYFNDKKFEEKNILAILKFIPRLSILYFIGIIIAFYLVFDNLKNVNPTAIFGIVIAFIIIYYLLFDEHQKTIGIFKKNREKIDFLTKIMYDNDLFIINFIDKNNVLLKGENINNFSLHHNPLLVDFFYKTRNFYITSPNNYLTTLIYANSIVILNEDMKIGVDNPFQNLKNAEMIYKETMNSFESMLHSLDNQMDKFNNSTELLQSILLSILTNMKQICKEHNQEYGININSIPDNSITEITHVEPNDTNSRSYMPNYNYF